MMTLHYPTSCHMIEVARIGFVIVLSYFSKPIAMNEWYCTGNILMW